MSLFDVEGWSLPKVVQADSLEKNKDKKDKKQKSKANTKANKAKKNKKLAPEELEQLIEKHLEGKSGESKGKKEKKTTDTASSNPKSEGSKKRMHTDDDKSDKKSEQQPLIEQHKTKKSKGDPRSKNTDNIKDSRNVKHSKDRSAESGADMPMMLSGNKKLTPLQQKMLEKLSGSRFRWINEQLYTTSSENALSLVQKNPELFDEYHKGYRNQVQSWPENPVDTMVEQFKKRMERSLNAPGGLSGDPTTGLVVVADMGCGEAQLSADLEALTSSNNKGRTKTYIKSKRLHFKVHSFDLKKANDRITVADIKNVPLPDQSVDVVVFCLSLMGTNFMDFIREAFRLLRPRGEVWIAEIKSRFQDQDGAQFVSKLKEVGLFHKTTDDSNKMFIRFEFFKPPKDIMMERMKKQEARKDRVKFIDEDESAANEVILKPCIYKRR